MKNILLIFSGILFFAGVSCKSQSKTGDSSDKNAAGQPTVFKGVKNDSCAVEVGFGSYGGGIDGKAYEAVMAKIDAKKLKYSLISVGREGETRICLPLTEIKGKEKSEFIDQLKKIAVTGELVSVSIR